MEQSPNKPGAIYSIVDIETTGGHRNGNKITELAIINFDGEKILEEYSTLINPERSIPWQITRLTGIDNQMVAGAPKFYQVAKKIVEMTEGNIFVAHNVFFDFNFIKMEFAELGYSFNPEKLCTVRLARKYLPGHTSYSLGKICHDLGIKIEGRHRAMGDTRATLELFKHIQLKTKGVEILPPERKAIPAGLSLEIYQQLPHETGIYYFYDKNGTLLYIGKSKDIKSRINSHFRPDMGRTREIELKNNIADIKYRLTRNELAALLLECQEIKNHFPPFNHALKRKKFPYALELVKAKDGIREFRICHKEAFSDYYYCFKSKRTAQKKIDSFYQGLLGHPQESIHFLPAKETAVKTLGKEKYNEMLEALFFKRIPKDKDFNLHFEKDRCFIEVKDFHPASLSYYTTEGEIEETIEFCKDQDMADILRNYMYQHNIKGQSHV